MQEFVLAALPWVMMGLEIVIAVAHEKKDNHDYIGLGLCIGMCAGVAVGSMKFTNGNYTIPLIGCSLIGELIGMSLKKGKDKG